MHNNNHDMWTEPWRLTEGIVIGCGLVVTGLLMQCSMGAINWQLLAWPVNIIIMALFAIVATGMHAARKRSYVCRWMSSHEAAIASMGWAVALTLVMGLTRQAAGPAGDDKHSLADLVGITRCLSWWPFVLVYMWLTLSLALTVMRRASSVTLRNVPFMVMHTGLLLVLLCGTLGSADMQRLKMMTKQGQPEWRAQDEQGNLHSLDLAIALQSFTIDEYPPKLMIADIKTGDALPAGKPVHAILDSAGAAGNIMGWDIKVVRLYKHAAAVFDTASVHYVEWFSRGATTAALIEVSRGDRKISDWVSCGSFMFPSKELRLDSTVCLFMPEPEPLRYASAVKVITKDGLSVEDTISVNKPLDVDKWKIYQLDYDREMGRWSDVSIFELVTDPWLPVVYTGIALLLLGAVLMFLIPARNGNTGNNTNGDENLNNN